MIGCVECSSVERASLTLYHVYALRRATPPLKRQEGAQAARRSKQHERRAASVKQSMMGKRGKGKRSETTKRATSPVTASTSSTVDSSSASSRSASRASETAGARTRQDAEMAARFFH